MAFLPLLQSIPPLLPTDFTTTVISQHWNPEGWGPVAGYALLISLLVVALAYMIAEILRSPQLNAWAKSELYEFIVSALIIANLFFGLTVLNSFVYYTTGGLDHFALAQSYLDELTRAPTLPNFVTGIVTGSGGIGSVTGVYLKLVSMEVISGLLGSFYIQAMIPLMGDFGLLYSRIGFVPFGGLDQFVQPVLAMTDMVGVILMVLIAQKSLLTFFQESMFSLFLPLGVVLRTFPLSRRLGATIIAISITCYIVYPLTLAMNLGIYDSVPHQDVLADAPLGAQTGCLQGRMCSSSADCCGAPCGMSMTCGACPTWPTPSGLPGGRCFSSRDCCGAPCIGGICTSCPSIGSSCTSPADCCGAPCESGGCAECHKQGDTCDNDAQCCGLVCFEDPDTHSKTCQLFAPGALFDSTYLFRENTDPGCTGIDPTNCNDDSDCPCSNRCVMYPTGLPAPNNFEGHCGAPDLNQDDYLALLQTSEPIPNIEPPSHTAWWLSMFGKGEEVKTNLDDLDASVLFYLFSPTAIPLFFFDIVENSLAGLMWPVVAASMLSILDLIICITFFRSISESIGGESSIMGLSKAL